MDCITVHYPTPIPPDSVGDRPVAATSASRRCCREGMPQPSLRARTSAGRTGMPRASGEGDEVEVVLAPVVLDAVREQQDAFGLQRLDRPLVVGHQHDGTLVG